MPGIAGIISHRFKAEARLQLDSMVRALMHEDFYTSGSFVNEKGGVAVGWVSHPGSFSDCMPVWNEEKNVLLVWTGEDYQERSRIDKLRTGGHEFSATNASYLVHFYEELGLKFLEDINGWFSGLLVDFQENRKVLFNDRFGIGRVCYYEDEHGFYFSSEAKSLLKIFPHLRALDIRSLAEMYSCGSVLQDRTLFSGISLLPGGSAWSFPQAQPTRKDRYFEPRIWEEQPKLNEADYYEQLKDTWQWILPKYFARDESAGLSLTGGVDSRMILACAPCPPGKLPCYTFSGRYRDCNDVKLARRLAELTHQPYQSIPIDGHFMSEFPSLVEKVAFIGEGNLDASGSIDLFVQREARKIAPVRVTGTNGGEVLRRLVMFKPTRLAAGLFSPEFERPLREAELTYTEELNCHRLSFTAFKQTPWYMNSKFVVERSQITVRLPFCDNELVRLSYQAPSRMAEDTELALRLVGDANPALAQIGTDRALRLGSFAGTGRARHLLQEFTFKAEYAYDYGMPQWLASLDHRLAPLHLERLFLGRHKFHHFRVYYRDELSSYVRDILLDARTLNRSFLRKEVVEEIVRGHLAGYRNYTLEIHKLLTIELVQRQLVEQN
jgi:asparagine synthase (glutamine-hydrolysing)